MNIAKINSKIVYIYLYIYGGLKAHNLNLLTKVNCQVRSIKWGGEGG